jgi:hypothetical protein
MKFAKWGGIGILAVVYACGGGSSVTGNAGTTGIGASPALNITVAGGGTVMSPDGSINCTATCSQTSTVGAAVHLDAAPASGMQFMGWSGACSGTGGCDLTITGDTAVGAAFAAVATVLFQVTPVGAGSGVVTSSPEGLSCPGICGMSVAPGTIVTLTATANVGSQFEGFGGTTCSGTTCSAKVTAAATVFANFSVIATAQPPVTQPPASQPPADPCASLIIPTLPAAKTASVPSWDEDPAACGAPFSDGAGNLYLETEYALNSSAGLAADHESLFVPLNSGFTAFSIQMAPEGGLTAFAADGTVLSSAPMIGYMSNAGLQANGGVVAVEAACYVSDTIQIRKIDGDGKLTSEFALAGEHCLGWDLAYLAVAVDAQERILLSVDAGLVSGSGIAAGHVASRWYDPVGQPITTWFETPPTDSVAYLPIPLIGGGVAVQSGSSWQIVTSGQAEINPGPASFGSKTNITTALGGKAYAVVPGANAGTIDIVEPGGKLCGSLTVPTGFTLSGGGSLVSVPPEGRDPVTNLCTVTYYPGALK